MGILADILGTGDVVRAGIDLIDDMHTSDEEAIAAKAKAKTDLLWLKLHQLKMTCLLRMGPKPKKV